MAACQPLPPPWAPGPRPGALVGGAGGLDSGPPRRVGHDAVAAGRAARPAAGRRPSRTPL